MAETIHLFLTIDDKRVLGESSQRSLGRDGSIECLELRDALSASGRDGVAVELRLLKRPDRSSPSLAQALIARSTLAGELRYYRPNPTGDGTTEQHLTVTIAGARITSLTRLSPNAADPETASAPVTEEIVLAVGEIAWLWNPTGEKAAAKVR